MNSDVIISQEFPQRKCESAFAAKKTAHPDPTAKNRKTPLKEGKSCGSI
jgi:hypothetical protein